MYKRYIYIGDIHGRKDVIDFINEKDDGNTFFIFLGDLFDRGKHSYEVFRKVEELDKKGICKVVIGNHDLFLIFSTLSNPSLDTYKSQLERIPSNGGKKTINSFRKHIVYKKVGPEQSLGQFKVHVSKFLLEKGDLYYIDDLSNLSIHGGIPIFYDGQVVGDSFGYNNFFSGLDYVKCLNKKLKERDNDTIRKFSGNYDTSSIINSNNIFFDKNYTPLKDYNNYTSFLPTWYLNREYDLNENVREALYKELEKNSLNRFICGHDSRQMKSTIPEDSRVIRLDRNIGYTILDDKNNFIEGGVI